MLSEHIERTLLAPRMSQLAVDGAADAPDVDVQSIATDQISLHATQHMLNRMDERGVPKIDAQRAFKRGTVTEGSRPGTSRLSYDDTTVVVADGVGLTAWKRKLTFES